MDYIQCIQDLKDDFDKVQEKIFPEDPSTAQNISVHLTKLLILTCTSTYEQRLQEAYINYARQESARYGDRPNRFDFDKSDKSVYQKFTFGYIEDANDLKTLPGVKKSLEKLNFFGEKFRDAIEAEVNNDVDKENQLSAFTELFAIRNLIAHQTFVEFSSNRIRGKSFQDIMDLHKKAILFVDYLIGKFI